MLYAVHDSLPRKHIVSICISYSGTSAVRHFVIHAEYRYPPWLRHRYSPAPRVRRELYSTVGIRSRRSRLSRTTSNPAQKYKWKLSGAKISFFCLSGENFGTILSRRSQLSRISRAPSQLTRSRPIDCDRESEQTVKFHSRFLAIFFFEHRRKNVF